MGNKNSGVKKHGHRKNDNRTPTYNSWRAMKARCYYTKHDAYYNYGGRNITICNTWLIFENFLSDMGQRPVGKSLDRIDPDGNYTPENCRWATNKQQAQNKRNKSLDLSSQSL